MVLHKLQLTGIEYNVMTQPCVYIWKRGDEYLYVGSTKSGYARLTFHNVIGVAERVLPEDVIIIAVVDSKDDAKVIEREVIKTHRPKWNRMSNPDHEHNDGVHGGVIANQELYNPSMKGQA